MTTLGLTVGLRRKGGPACAKQVHINDASGREPVSKSMSRPVRLPLVGCPAGYDHVQSKRCQFIDEDRRCTRVICSVAID